MKHVYVIKLYTGYQEYRIYGIYNTKVKADKVRLAISLTIANAKDVVVSKWELQ